jgi:hypothetical protein
VGYILKGGKPLNTRELPTGDATVKPGMLLAISAGTFIKHATQGGLSQPIFADARAGAADVVGGSVASGLYRPTWAQVIAVASGELIPGLKGPGMQVLGWLADGQSVIEGQALQSAGNGQLEAFSAGAALIEQTFAFDDMTDNAGTATGFIDLTTLLPAGAVPIGWTFDVLTGFTGDTTAVMQVGIAGDLDRFSAATSRSVLTAAQVGSHVIAADGLLSVDAAVAIRVTITGGADFTSIDAGEGTIRFYYLPQAYNGQGRIGWAAETKDNGAGGAPAAILVDVA